VAESGGERPLVELPRGMYPGRLDEKGRLKVAAPFQRYYEALEEKTLFVTSLDRRTAAVYTLAAWRATELFLENTDDQESAAVVTFVANELGSEVEMDGQGRILFNAELRRVLKLESTELHLYRVRNHIEVVPHALYEELQVRATVDAETAVKNLRRFKLP